MMIFVGGRRHGTVWKWSGATSLIVGDADATPPEPTPPPSYVDMQTGDQYSSVSVALRFPHPLTDQAIATWAATVYMHVELLPHQEQAMAMLQDAVARWWFTTHGTRRDETVPAASNGHTPAPTTVYSADCEVCTGRMVGDNPRDRARWIRAHMDSTGHTVRWSDNAPTTEGT